jgi:CBS domain-containing protein
MKAKEIMTPSPECCSATDSVQDVARLMRDNDCGVIPIVAAGTEKVIGIVTDRDLAVRGYAEGKGADSKVGDLMTASPACCKTTDDVRDVEKAMTENQVRRVPIVDEAGRCVGIVSQADIARASSGDGVSEREVAILVEKISQPSSQPPRKTGDSFLEL